MFFTDIFQRKFLLGLHDEFLDVFHSGQNVLVHQRVQTLGVRIRLNTQSGEEGLPIVDFLDNRFIGEPLDHRQVFGKQGDFVLDFAHHLQGFSGIQLFE